MRLAYLVLCCLPVLGQTSRGSSVTKAPGELVTLQIFATSQPARAPMALKWEIVFPAQLMDLEGEAETGTAARDSGKSLECKPRKPYSFSCYLSGGKNTIGDGQIAVFHFRIGTTAAAGKTVLRVEKAAATMADGKEEMLNSTESIVIIR
jgi:hypothetical protein